MVYMGTMLRTIHFQMVNPTKVHCSRMIAVSGFLPGNQITFYFISSHSNPQHGDSIAPSPLEVTLPSWEFWGGLLWPANWGGNSCFQGSKVKRSCHDSFPRLEILYIYMFSVIWKQIIIKHIYIYKQSGRLQNMHHNSFLCTGNSLLLASASFSWLRSHVVADHYHQRYFIKQC